MTIRRVETTLKEFSIVVPRVQAFGFPKSCCSSMAWSRDSTIPFLIDPSSRFDGRKVSQNYQCCVRSDRWSRGEQTSRTGLPAGSLWILIQNMALHQTPTRTEPSRDQWIKETERKPVLMIPPTAMGNSAQNKTFSHESNAASLFVYKWSVQQCLGCRAP